MARGIKSDLIKKETKVNKKQSFDKTHDIKPLYIYIAVVHYGDGAEVVEIFKNAGSSLQFVQIGEGTASRHVLEILGIEDSRKEIVFSLIKGEDLQKATTELEVYFTANHKSRGIGFSIALTGLAGVKMYQFLTQF